MISLVLGGVRSGKSGFAERRAGEVSQSVTYFATASVGEDFELAERVEAHRRRRPDSWTTVEVSTADSSLPELLRSFPGTALIDSLGTWVASSWDEDGCRFGIDIPGLCASLVDREDDSFVVSEEVGLGVHPMTSAGRLFCDALGGLNQAISEVADEVWLVVAGRTLRLGAG